MHLENWHEWSDLNRRFNVSISEYYHIHAKIAVQCILLCTLKCILLCTLKCTVQVFVILF